MLETLEMPKMLKQKRQSSREYFNLLTDFKSSAIVIFITSVFSCHLHCCKLMLRMIIISENNCDSLSNVRITFL